MSISTEYRDYRLTQLRRASIRSWLSTFVALGQRFRDMVPPFEVGIPLSDVAPVHDIDVGDQHKHPHAHASRATYTPPLVDAPPADTANILTAAIELKFLLPVLKPGTDDNGFEHDGRPILVARDGETGDQKPSQALIRRAHESVASTISQHAAAAAQQRSVTLHDIVDAGWLERECWETDWIVKKANSAEPTEREIERGANYIWVPVEICSPKQRWDDERGLADALQSIGAVVRAITARHRVTVNYTCDVHVHVGRADGEHLSLVTFKKLATMLWLSEDLLRTIRDPASPNHDNVYTWGAELTKHSRLAKLIHPYNTKRRPHERPKDTLHNTTFFDNILLRTPALQTIWNAPSHLELGRLLSGPDRQFRRLGFNFSALGEEDERARTGPKTIEFRILEGTMDQDIIAAWVQICWAFVEVAGEAAPKKEDGDDGRFIKVIKACVRGVERCPSPGSDSLEGWAGSKQRRDEVVMRGQLRGVVVGGLGVEGRVYDAFVEALLRGRGI